MLDELRQSQDTRFCEIMQKIDRLYEDYAKSRGMTYMSMAVLDAICTLQPDCTQKQICAATHYPKQSVNLIIRSFWQSGYVTLEELPQDRRNKRVLLTDQGRAYAEKTVGVLWQVDNEATARLTTDQRETLLHLLSLYADAYEQGVRATMEKD